MGTPSIVVPRAGVELHTARRRGGLVVAVAIAIGAALVAAPAGAATPSARELLDLVDDLFRGQASHGRATMVVATAHWTRTLTLEAWNKGKEQSLIRILAPEKEKGTATLKVGTDLWNYLPKVKRVIKLPSSMLSASWMGSHFTNDDLVKESRMTEDYTFETTFEGTRDGQAVVEITCLPKPEAAVVWGKVVVRVRHGDWLPLVVDFHDEQMKVARTITYTDVRRLGDRTIPSTFTVVPTDKPAESTRVTWEDLRFDVSLDDELFTLRELQK